LQSQNRTVLLASATQADDLSTAVVIIGFNVRPEARAAEVAKHEDVPPDIRLHSIIYKVEEEIRAAMIGMLDAIEKEVILGKGTRSGNVQGFEDWNHRGLRVDGRRDPTPGEGTFDPRRSCHMGRRYRDAETVQGRRQ
jgi:translation initiation factor IF-2